MPRADPVLIFDLDGTVLSRNSFPYWVRSLLSGGPQGGLHARLTLSWQVQRLLLRRKLGRLEHDSFLRELQRLWNAVEDPAGRKAIRLQARLLRLVRPSLKSALQSLGNLAFDSVLATAAAAEYAEPLGRALGFAYVLATAPYNTMAPCNRGEHKRERVLRFLDEHGWTPRPRVFFTDHMDDLPLMQVCQTVCWFGNNPGLRAARAAAPATRFVPCRQLDDREMQQTLAHIRQSLETAHLARNSHLAWPRVKTLS